MFTLELVVLIYLFGGLVTAGYVVYEYGIKVSDIGFAFMFIFLWWVFLPMLLYECNKDKVLIKPKRERGSTDETD